MVGRWAARKECGESLANWAGGRERDVGVEAGGAVAEVAGGFAMAYESLRAEIM